MDINQHNQNRLELSQMRIAKIFWVTVLILIAAGYSVFSWLKKPEAVSEGQESATQPIEEKPSETVASYQIGEGDIPAEIFSQYGKWDANAAETLLEAGKEVYDLSSLKMGKEIRFYFNGEEQAKRLEYERDTERVVIAERNGGNFSVREEKINYTVSQEVARGVISNFFYADALEAGLSESTVLEIGDIFSFSVDFTTEIRQGDEFTVLYEKRDRDGRGGPDGKILAAKFVNEGTAHYAYYFDLGGEGGYYDGEGKALERQFLKAPLSYRRITSGFTGARFHPITRTVSAHYQVDYSAPVGTPVVSTARGTVVSAGWEGGWGNIVRLRHDSGYTTQYAHLSGFAKGLRSGVSVAQGQLIGFVGSTGWSTGAHLDYGIRRSGSPVNPLKMDLPKGNPLSPEKMMIFEEIKKQYAGSL